MRLKILGIALALFVGFWFLGNKSSEPTMYIEAEILALEDVVGTAGLRRIQVKLPDGDIMWIETLAPFFYRVGYTAKLAVYEPLFRARYYKFVAD